MTSKWDEQREMLLPDIKNYLDITWSDDALDKKIWGITVAGMLYLDSKIGTAQDYTAPGLARALLMDYVRYTRDGSADIFEHNYLHLLLAARNERLVTDFAENTQKPDPP